MPGGVTVYNPSWSYVGDGSKFSVNIHSIFFLTERKIKHTNNNFFETPQLLKWLLILTEIWFLSPKFEKLGGLLGKNGASFVHKTLPSATCYLMWEIGFISSTEAKLETYLERFIKSYVNTLV